MRRTLVGTALVALLWAPQLAGASPLTCTSVGHMFKCVTPTIEVDSGSDANAYVNVYSPPAGLSLLPTTASTSYFGRCSFSMSSFVIGGSGPQAGSLHCGWAAQRCGGLFAAGGYVRGYCLVNAIKARVIKSKR